MSLIKEYLELTKRFKDEFGELTIILMQNGAFFEVYALKDDNDNIHGCNILDFSRICDLNIVDKKAAGDKHVIINSSKVVNAGFKTHLIEKYIKKLQDSGYTVVVYEEDEEEDVTTKKKNRSLTGVYSPGTFFSFDPEMITNNTCCIWIEIKKPTLKSVKRHIYIGVSQIDIYTGTTSIMEYNEIYINNPCTFDELERFISIYKPSETIFVSTLSEKELDDIISYANIQSKSIHYVSLSEENKSKNSLKALNCEKQVYQTQLLNKFYKINDIQSFMGIFNENVYATQSFCYLLDFIYQHNPNLVYKIEEPVLENTSKRLILANHSLKQLNIIDDDNYKGKYSSVVKMLNECITPMGKRKFAYNFLNPVTDEEYLQKEYNIVETLLLNSNEYTIVKNMLVQIKDISKIMRQIMLVKITPKSMHQLYLAINSAKEIYNYVISRDNLCEYLKNKIKNFECLLKNITIVSSYLEKVLVLEACKDIDNIQKIESSFIQENVDTDLDNKIKTLSDSQDQLEACRSYFSSIISNYETGVKKGSKKKKNEEEQEEGDVKSYVNIHETDKNNFSLIATDRRCKILEEVVKNNKTVTLKYKSSLKNEEMQFSLSLELEYNKQSCSNKTITNNQIYNLCKNVGSIKVNLIDTIAKVYQSIVKRMQDYQDELTNISDLITYIDLVYAKMFIAEKYNYCKPEIVSNSLSEATIGSTKSFIVATDLRHCLIEKIQQTELYVANDISIGQGTNKKESLDGILLYGTNAVGKTSFIRALGISVIMAQSGLYVPASSYRFKPYKYIFTRILGNDNIFKGLSTFAVEMSELRTILRLADENSLVLGDELCSGTESISAVSIFVAGVQQLATIGCSFIFATHLHEIIGYDEIASLHNVGMKHMSVIYDKEKDCLVYNRKLQDGPGNNMYGLEVCKSLCLPEDFLENAHNIRMKYHPESASILQQKGSHFNAKHISGGICEKCNLNLAIDVHHLIFQNEADDNGTIQKKSLTFKKNNKANLINLCQKCHDDIHKTNKKYKKTKTTIGTTLEEI
jgi:DNA mismatch repair protein MutS